jgi:hypothetical protein
MARPLSVEALPIEVRKFINTTLCNNGYGDYAGLTDELRNRFGVNVTRSALHRYGVRLKNLRDEKLASDVEACTKQFSEVDFANLRATCLLASVQSGPDGVFERAERYFEWVIGGAKGA